MLAQNARRGLIRTDLNSRFPLAALEPASEQRRGRRTTFRLLQIIVAALLSGCLTFGDDPVDKRPDNSGLVRLIQYDRVPQAARKYLDAVGDRVVKAGRERNVGAGTIVMGETGSPENISWTWEFPAKIRYQRASAKGAISFNPQKRADSGLDELEEEILETLSADTTDEWLDKMQDGVTPRFLGSNFLLRSDGSFGSSLDLFEIGIPVAARARPGSSVKQFQFDSATGLLYRVTYEKMLAGGLTPVTTQYSRYELVDGQPTPRKITRLNGERILFQINVANVQWKAAAADGLFP